MGNTSATVPRVAVLLPTHNGEAYLSPLLDSLESQEGVRIHLFTLDDFSQDRSAELVDARGSSLNVVRSKRNERIGLPGVFLELLKEVNGGFEFVSFCDQDDVWFPSKSQVAVGALEHVESPALHVSSVSPFSETQGESIGLAEWMNVGEIKKGLSRVILGNIAPGCAMTMNRKLLGLLQNGLKSSGSIVMHDWWTLLVAIQSGEVILEREPQVAYRLHAGNAVGLRQGISRVINPTRGLAREKIRDRWRQLEFSMFTANGEADSGSTRELAVQALMDALRGKSNIGNGLGGYLEALGRAVAFQVWR